MKKILALAVAGPAIAVAMPAFAQESPEATFTGPRVEAILGYDILKAGSSIDGTYDENNSIDGLLYGAGERPAGRIVPSSCRDAATPRRSKCCQKTSMKTLV